MKIRWAKYLQKTIEYQKIVTDENYIDAWKNLLEQNEDSFLNNELLVISSNIPTLTKIWCWNMH